MDHSLWLMLIFRNHSHVLFLQLYLFTDAQGQAIMVVSPSLFTSVKMIATLCALYKAYIFVNTVKPVNINLLLGRLCHRRDNEDNLNIVLWMLSKC